MTWLLLAALAAPAPAAAPVSLVLITLDTTRADHLGCYGAAFAATPALDALARKGVRFDAALSPAPTTAPAHASLLTGRVPRHHGVRDNAGFTLHTDVPTLASVLQTAGYDTAAFVSSYVLDRSVGLDRGFSTYDDTVRIGDRRAFNHEERAGSQTTDRALAKLPSLASPFFLWVHLYDPHLPYVPPEPYASRFKGRPYDGEIAFMDAQVGRVREALERRGTPVVIVVAADHGESLGEHGEDGHGVFLYQATQRVPLILSGRGVPEGRVVSASVGLIDVLPTVLELLGRPAVPGADGRSLVAALRGTGPPASPPDYEMETFYPAFAFGWSPLRALVSGPWKYVLAPRAELYRWTTDPRERRDLVLDSELSGRASAMAETLARRIGTDAPVAADDDSLDERRQRLSALGYAGGSPAPGAGAEAIDPKDGIVLVRGLDEARRAIQSGHPADALAPLSRLLERNPTNVQALLTLARAQELAGQTAAAVATARRATALAPSNALARLRLAGTLAAEAVTRPAARAEAEAAFEDALTLAPRYAEGYLEAASFHGALRDLDGARSVLTRARAAGIEDPSIELELGALDAAAGDTAASRAAFLRAVELNPREAGALERLGRLDFEEGRFGQSAGWYERALEAAPTATLAKTLGAIRMEKLNDLVGARAAFRRALALDPDDPDAPELRALIDDPPR